MSVLDVALLSVPPKLTGESTKDNEIHWQTYSYSLLAVFDLILAPLHYVSYEDMVMDCVDGKTGLFFPVRSAWIANHAEHTTWCNNPIDR